MNPLYPKLNVGVPVWVAHSLGHWTLGPGIVARLNIKSGVEGVGLFGRATCKIHVAKSDVLCWLGSARLGLAGLGLALLG